jgi:hypothetical protein
MMILRLALFAAIVTMSPTDGRSQSAPVLTLPIACHLGQDCLIQGYMDHDPTENARDFKCGPRTYDAHNGTDFRIPDMSTQKRGVSVLAVADGTVSRVRDGMEDISVRVIGQKAVKDMECGNGIVINHADGWSSQYCHMAKGSIVVHRNEKVTAGRKLGLVGLSGQTEFPHVHLTIRQNGTIIDPFAYQGGGSCGDGRSLWDTSLSSALAYHEAEVLNKGFASAAVSMESIEAGEVEQQPLNETGSLVAYVRAIGLKAGDVQTLQIYSPDGSLFLEKTFEALDANKAQAFISIGRKTPTRQWQTGEFKGVYVLKRANAEILRSTFSGMRKF